MSETHDPTDFEGESEIYLPIQGYVADDSVAKARVTVDGNWTLRGTTDSRNWPTAYEDEENEQFVAFTYDPKRRIREIDVGFSEGGVFVVMDIRQSLASEWSEGRNPIKPDSFDIEQHWPKDSSRPVILEEGQPGTVVLWRPHKPLDRTLRDLPLKHLSRTLQDRCRFGYSKFGLRRGLDTDTRLRNLPSGRNPERAKELHDQFYGTQD